MSAQYDLYLQQHRNNVYKGFRWIQENLPELLVDGVAWIAWRSGAPLPS